jgi:hypothetical protein
MCAAENLALVVTSLFFNVTQKINYYLYVYIKNFSTVTSKKQKKKGSAKWWHV